MNKNSFHLQVWLQKYDKIVGLVVLFGIACLGGALIWKGYPALDLWWNMANCQLVEGKLEKVWLESNYSVADPDFANQWIVHLQYQYRIGDTTYRNDNQWTSIALDDPQETEQTLQQYQEGMQVNICYNPHRPRQAWLHNHNMPWETRIIALALCVVGLLLIISAGLYSAKIWLKTPSD